MKTLKAARFYRRLCVLSLYFFSIMNASFQIFIFCISIMFRPQPIAVSCEKRSHEIKGNKKEENEKWIKNLTVLIMGTTLMPWSYQSISLNCFYLHIVLRLMFRSFTSTLAQPLEPDTINLIERRKARINYTATLLASHLPFQNILSCASMLFNDCFIKY